MTNAQAQPMTPSGEVVGSLHIAVRAPVTRRSNVLESPTILVAIAIYGGFFVLTWFFQHLSEWVAVPIGAVLLTWHGSLQHETIHGHPTRSRRLNFWLASPPLALWIPYRIYRATHLQHHRHGGRHLAEVSRDPESFFRRPGTLSRSGFLRRALYLANCTLIGRLIVGPVLSIARLWAAEMRKMLNGDRQRRIIWARHIIAMAIVLLWTTGVCHIPVGVYLILMVYPSVSLSHLRSFTEHRSHPQPSHRTMAVEAHPLWALLFLNNNLHIAHHAHPELPWYQLPQAWRRMRGSANAAGLVFHGGYRQVAASYLFRPVISVEHPDDDEVMDLSAANGRE